MSLTRLFLVAAAAVSTIPDAGDLLDAIASVEDQLSTYLALGASAIAVSELAPLFGGIAALEGQLRLGRVIAAITLGGWGATTLLYLLGRLKWDWIRRSVPSARSAGTVALRIVRRNPSRASFLVRFLFGGRIILPMACGAARVPLGVYLPMSFVGSLAWSVTYALIGLIAGQAVEQMLGRLERVEGVMMALLAGFVLFFGVWFWRRRVRRVERRAAVRRVPRTPTPSSVPVVPDPSDRPD